jgi:predicted porin
MKHPCKTLICLSLLMPAAAMAQTALGGDGVVFYGKVDLALDSTHFSSTPARAGTSATYLSNDISYWGLRGNEDLGSGTRAYFKLESGFSADTGANTGGATQFFDRESYVGYGAGWGSIQLGSQWTPSLYVQARSDPFTRQANGSGVSLTQQTPGNQRGFLGAFTANNAVQYNSPTFGGVTAHVLYALAERTTAPTNLGAVTDGSVDYFNGRLYVGAAYENQILASVPAGGTLSNKTYSLGATYDFNVVKLFGYLMHNTLTNAQNVNAYFAGFNYPFGVSTIKGTYSGRNMTDTNGGSAHFFALGYYYYLSKRTTLYTSVAHMVNGSATNIGLWPSSKTYSPPVIAGGSGLPVGGQNVNSIEFGISHTF